MRHPQPPIPQLHRQTDAKTGSRPLAPACPSGSAVLLSLSLSLLAIVIVPLFTACEGKHAPEAAAVNRRDSTAVMVTRGVSKLISDSGLIRYKIVAEEWRVYDLTNPPRQVFPKGLLLEKFNPKFHIQMYITADTAYWYDQNLWELRGRVVVWNENGNIFRSNLLFWDMRRHEFYSYLHSRLRTPDREVEGESFRSNEQMTRYEVNTTSAVFPMPEEEQPLSADSDSITLPPPAAAVPEPVSEPEEAVDITADTTSTGSRQTDSTH